MKLNNYKYKQFTADADKTFRKLQKIALFMTRDKFRKKLTDTYRDKQAIKHQTGSQEACLHTGL